MQYLLDTNTCIAAMRHDPRVLARLASLAPPQCAVSTVTTYELHTGVEKCAMPAKELAKVNLFLATLRELNFDGRAAKEAAQIRAFLEARGAMIGAYEVLLAGHARSAGLALVSANIAEFSRVPALKLENWQAPPAP